MTGVAGARLEVPEAELSVPGGLPDPFVCLDGTPVPDAAAWWERRRPELLDLFAHQMYGVTPAVELPMRTHIRSEDATALDGRSTRLEVELAFGAPGDAPVGGEPTLSVLVHLPNDADRPVPVFVTLNFRGNDEVEVGGRGEPWPLARLVERGYGVATMCYEDIEPDVDAQATGTSDATRTSETTGTSDATGATGTGRRTGILRHPLVLAADEGRPTGERWGALGAWAWGLSRVLDYLVGDPRVDPRRVIVAGHSRLGKAAMWAAAQDRRFAMAVSNNSGCGGVALSRRLVGETVEAITSRFPRWFCGNFAGYCGREEALPFDQHLLVALVAPRPVYVASAEDDTWADPYGEFLGARYADPVYQLLGVEGIGTTTMPPVSSPSPSRIGYHIRPGAHAMTAYDWEQFADAADRHLLPGT
jgi:hypothetical protein